jgi:hypothetical protein
MPVYIFPYLHWTTQELSYYDYDETGTTVDYPA